MNGIKSLKYQQGYLILITIVLIVIVGFIAVALAYITFGSSFATINLQKSNSALYIADSGLEDATHQLNAFILTDRSACTGLSITNAAIGDGTYTVTATGPFYTSVPTTLNGALTAVATSITVTSTTNYQSSGRIMIDKEFIDYAATDATHFLFAQRGVDGSTAAAHVTGTTVGQYQCRLLSTGGAPKLTFTNPGDPGGKRTLNETIQLQEAWAVGDNSSGNLSLMRWNRPTELIWNDAPLAGTSDLNGVSMTSYVDGWAVGQNASFLRWNGSAWTSVATGLTSVIYNGVFCLSKNNCHAVGNMVGGSSNLPTIADWNGTTWTATTLNVGIRAGHQWSVHCASPTDCWSVGDIGTSITTSRFYHWNGATWSGTVLTGFVAGNFPYKGVFCTSTANCWAVGSNANFARWNGTAWTIVTTALPGSQYNSIYCNNASDCWAVGNTNGGNDLIVHWDGTAWSRDASNPSPTTILNGVACSGKNDCWAVGNASSGEPSFVHWDGTSWTKVTTTVLPNVPANAISMIGPGSQPWSAWTENFA